MANCTYHASALDPMLTGATQLLKPGIGELVIISSSRQSLYELITRFYSHQRTYELYTAETVTAALGKLGINYKVEQDTTAIDSFLRDSRLKKLHLFWITLSSQSYRIMLLNFPSCVWSFWNLFLLLQTRQREFLHQ